jgi:hexosaminidase
MKKLSLFSFLLLQYLSVIAATLHDKYPLIPWPEQVTELQGSFVLNTAVPIIIASDTLSTEASYMNEFLQNQYGFQLKVKSGKKAEPGSILITDDLPKGSVEGAYELKITPNEIQIRGAGSTGVFYALQTIWQLLPQTYADRLDVPCVSIKDKPRFSWRGMHLDVARHFYPIGYVKRYIDNISRYKMNYFHWHLTDDQGWRIEIKQYPQLQAISAWRSGTRKGHYSSYPEEYDTTRYGGYYTQDQIKEVVAYAANRHITVVPEIEMPGHAQAALAAFPQLSCTGGPFTVARNWGVFQDVFCPKEETFTFLQNVLSEVCELFPGPYIHIGGDECPKDRWKACANCQARIKKEGLKDETELQSYFVKRIEKFVNTKGKRVIGWDEILEGGLAPDATVMSWRGEEGAVQAAKQGHDVVMTPTSNCYFDYYQSRSTGEGLAIGGYLPLDKVYAFEPVPDGLSATEAKHILGAQGNLWTEYVSTLVQEERMIFPRACALAEVVWSPKSSRNYDEFVTRLNSHFKTMSYWGLAYSKALYDVKTVVKPNEGKGIAIELSTPYKYGMIRYNMYNELPTGTSDVYTAPIKVDQSISLCTGVFDGTMLKGNYSLQIFKINYATGKPISLATLPDAQYSNGGAFTLVDGLTGLLPWNGADWLGFKGTNMEAVVDLGELKNINKVALDALSDEGSWIHFPKAAEVLVSEDGTNYKSVLRLDKLDAKSRTIKFPVGRMQTRFVKVVAENAGVIPEGKPGAGNPAWLFVDEIVVE